MSDNYDSFWRSLDPDTQEVVRRMDEHEGRESPGEGHLTEQLIEMLAKTYVEIGRVAERVAGDDESAEQHIETMLIVLSYVPNARSYWYVKELVDSHPQVYQYLFKKALSQRPLQMYGKVLRERILFYISRETLLNHIYSPDCRTILITALESLKRA